MWVSRGIHRKVTEWQWAGVERKKIEFYNKLDINVKLEKANFHFRGA